MTGKALNDIPDQEMRAYTEWVYATAVERRTALHFRDEPVLDGRRWRTEALLLPLSSDGVSVDMLMIYRTTDMPQAAAAWVPAPRYEPDLEFLDGVDVPLLNELVAYWDARRAGRMAPRPSDIDAMELTAHWPRLFMLDVLDGGSDFRYRLIGRALVQRMGRDSIGRRMSDLYAPEPAVLGTIVGRFRRVVDEKRPIFTRGRFFWVPDRRHRRFVSAAMPLSDDGTTVNIILGRDDAVANLAVRYCGAVSGKLVGLAALETGDVRGRDGRLIGADLAALGTPPPLLAGAEQKEEQKARQRQDRDGIEVQDGLHNGIPEARRAIALDRCLYEVEAARIELVPELAGRAHFPHAYLQGGSDVVGESGGCRQQQEPADDAPDDHESGSRSDELPRPRQYSLAWPPYRGKSRRAMELRAGLRVPLRCAGGRARLVCAPCRPADGTPTPWGGVAERSKAHAWKACIGATLSWVRIPLPPPVLLVFCGSRDKSPYRSRGPR